MKKGAKEIIVAGILQYGGAVAIGYLTTWIVGVAIMLVLWGHNVEKH